MRYVKDFFRFLLRPDSRQLEISAFREKVVVVLILLLLYGACNVLFAIVMAIYTLVANMGLMNVESAVSSKVFVGGVDVVLLLIVTFVAPVVEEFTFRYGLTEFDFTRVRVSLSLCGAVLLLFISRLFVDMSIFSSMKASYFYLCYYGVYCALGGGIFMLVPFIKPWILRLASGGKGYFRFVFYLSVVAFAGTHIFSTPLVGLVPVFIFGCILSYIRVRVGFKYALGAHIFMNMLASCMTMVRLS